MAERGVRRPSPGDVDLAAEHANVERRHRPDRRVVADRSVNRRLGGGAASIAPAGEQLDDVIVGRDRRGLGNDAVLRGAHQQPVQRGGDRVLRRCPPAHDLGLRAGDRDVQQAQPLTGLLVRPAAAVVGPVGAAAADVDAAPAVVVVEQRPGGLGDESVGDRREVDHGVLQPLAGVDRDQLHCLRVGVEPSGALDAAARAALGHLLAQPAQQGDHAQVVALGHLVQRLADVAQVGEPALPAHLGQDPPRQAAGRGGLEDGRDPAGAEHLDPRAQPVCDLVREVVAAAVELGGGVPEEAGQRRRPDPGAAMRLLESLEQRQPLHRRRGGEHAAATGDHGWHPHFGQGAAGSGQVGVAIADDRDIGRRDRPTLEGGTRSQ